MKKKLFPICFFVSLIFLTACTEETETNGSSLTAGTYFSDYATFSSNHPDIVGYGGVYIKLNSFSITDTE